MGLSCFDYGGFFPYGKDAHETLAGKVISFQPMFIQPPISIRREFREAELVETVGPFKRTYTIWYSGPFWCRRGAPGKGSDCAAVVDSPPGLSYSPKDTQGNYTGERVLSTLTPFIEIKSSTRDRCRYDALGFVSITEGAESPQSSASFKAAQEGPSAEQVWHLIDTAGPPQPVEDSKISGESAFVALAVVALFAWFLSPSDRASGQTDEENRKAEFEQRLQGLREIESRQCTQRHGIYSPAASPFTGTCMGAKP